MQDNLAVDLENDIIFGWFPPGSRIIEDRVMERYDAKRNAVRNAFALLEKRGLLVRKPNRGVEVVDFTPDQVDAEALRPRDNVDDQPAASFAAWT